MEVHLASGGKKAATAASIPLCERDATKRRQAHPRIDDVTAWCTSPFRVPGREARRRWGGPCATYWAGGGTRAAERFVASGAEGVVGARSRGRPARRALRVEGEACCLHPFYRNQGEKGTSGGSRLSHAPSERATEDGRSFRDDAAADRRVSLRRPQEAASHTAGPSLKTQVS